MPWRKKHSKKPKKPNKTAISIPLGKKLDSLKPSPNKQKKKPNSTKKIANDAKMPPMP